MGLLRGKTLGIDASTLEANAALRSIVLRDTGEGYREYLAGLAIAAGNEHPTREELAQLDLVLTRQRPKKGSNQDWKHPYDPEARVCGADQGDTTSMERTLLTVQVNLAAVAVEEEAAAQLHPQPLQEVVADKGYHSTATIVGLAQVGIRS